MTTETYYEWELLDASGEWAAGGSANNLADVRQEGQHYLAVYSAKDGPHKLLIHRHLKTFIEEFSLG